MSLYRGATYQSTNPRAAAHPLRSLPLYSPAVRVRGYTAAQQADMAKAQELHRAQFALTNAEALLAYARTGYVQTRGAIGDANRGVSWGLMIRDKRLARSLAFKRFNKSVDLLRQAETQVLAAQATLHALQPARTTFRVTAQSRTTTHRLAKVVEAATADDAIRAVTDELQGMGFYPVAAVAQQVAA